MLSIKKKIAILLTTIIAISSVLVVKANVATLPEFAIVESNSNNVKVYENKEKEKQTTTYKTAESSLKTTVEAPSFSFQSASQILMEATTGKVIYANNENERLLPASVTKIMTLLLLMEQIDAGNIRYTDKVTCSSEASKMGGSQIWFKEGETLTVDEALKCICVVSANDVSYAVAELIGGTNENFVKMMNNKAKELGMDNTQFMNAHGIDEDGHYTTAKDIALMSKELITKHPDITKYTTIWMDSIRGGQFGLSNTNKLIKTYKGITGLKTGSTSKALYNLSATATRDDLSLIAVVLKAPSSDIRAKEITSLLNYGFSTYSSKQLARKGEVVGNISISKNVTKKFDVVYEKDEYFVTKKGEGIKCNSVIEYIQDVRAPLQKGAIVGKAKFVDNNNNVVCETNLVINDEISKSNLLEYIGFTMKKFAIRSLK